ncbi:tetratricopeptide repeat protein [Candidatus Magnetomonas plexicatena]|uniref:tetratricopeptide repeat protein n=1 Tax=Candidatus Magnetomonas plexicatena TaxID=2552947 RepID=UPI001C7983B2|nr:tetratricopeptide repeat protein [Nitrospirales bacterium LBB_01]
MPTKLGDRMLIGINKIEKYLEEASEHTDASEYGKALRAYEKALKLCENEDESRLRCLCALADCERMSGKFTKAADDYKLARELANSLNDSVGALDSTVGWGLALRALGLWKDALQKIEDAEAGYVEKADKSGMAFCLWAKAGTFRIAGDIKQAVELFERAKDMFEQLEETSAIGYCHTGIGGAKRMAGDFAASLDNYNAANVIFKKVKDRFGLAYSYCGIGNALRMTGEFSESKKFLNRAAKIYDHIDDIVSSAYTLWSLGVLSLMQGKIAESEKRFAQALKYFKKTSDVRGLAYVFLGKAQVEFLSKRKQKAIVCVKKALDITARYSFSLEHCHGAAIMAALEGNSNTCHKESGIYDIGSSFPFNIP